MIPNQVSLSERFLTQQVPSECISTLSHNAEDIRQSSKLSECKLGMTYYMAGL